MSIETWLLGLVVLIEFIVICLACREIKTLNIEVKDLIEERSTMSNSFRIQGDELTRAKRQLKKCMDIKGKSKF